MRAHVTLIAFLFTGLTAQAQQAPLAAETKNFLVGQARKGINAAEFLNRRLDELQFSLSENVPGNQGRKACFHLGLATMATEDFFRYAMSVTMLSGADDATQRIMYRVNRFGDSGRLCTTQEPVDSEKVRNLTNQHVQDVNLIMSILKPLSASPGGEGWPK